MLKWVSNVIFQVISQTCQAKQSSLLLDWPTTKSRLELWEDPHLILSVLDQATAAWWATDQPNRIRNWTEESWLRTPRRTPTYNWTSPTNILVKFLFLYYTSSFELPHGFIVIDEIQPLETIEVEFAPQKQSVLLRNVPPRNNLFFGGKCASLELFKFRTNLPVAA